MYPVKKRQAAHFCGRDLEASSPQSSRWQFDVSPEKDHKDRKEH